MLLSTQTDAAFKCLGAEEGILRLAEAGFDALDFSMFGMKRDDDPLVVGDGEKYAEYLKKLAENAGLSFNQAHAPFPCWKYNEDEYNAKLPGRIEKSIRIAGILGAKSIVVHPIAYTQGNQIPDSDGIEAEKRQMEFNLAFFRSLEPLAKEYGIKIALENMWGRDKSRGYIVPNVCSFGADLARYFDELNPEAFTVCLDIGHCGLIGEEPQHAILALGGDRLGALHVHDNNFVEDLHTAPFTRGCKIDWNAVTNALGAIDYKGDFTYEADDFLSRCDRELMPAALRYMADIGRYLMRKIDAARPQNAK